MPVPPSVNDEANISENECVPPVYVYIHTALPSAQILDRDTYGKDHKHNKDCIPDFLTDEGTFTG